MTTLKRYLGNSDLLLSPIGLGAWQFGNQKRTWKPVTSQLVYDIMRTALQNGINWIDTAEVYGGGTSEAFIGRTLKRLQREKQLDQEIYIADKWFPLLRSANTIPKSIETSLSKLQVKSMDLYQIHQPSSLSSLRTQIKELAKFAEAGLIKHIGVSNFSAKRMKLADDLLKEHGLRLSSNQVKYNLLHRRPEKNGVLETAQELGVSIIAYSPLQQGMLTGRFHEAPDSIQNISQIRRIMSGINRRNLDRTQPLIDCLKQLAKKYQKTPAQISLNWLITAHGNSVFAIPGATSVSQMRSNLEAQNFELSADDIQLLNDVSS